MKHRIIATVTFEFDVVPESYGGVEGPDERLLIDIEGVSDNPDTIMNGDATITVDGELVP